MATDDVVIYTENRNRVEESLERWRYTLERRGMKISHSKAEGMCVEGAGVLMLLLNCEEHWAEWKRGEEDGTSKL